MKNDETVCWACGSVCAQHIPPSGWGKGFVSLINIAFIVSAAMTVASLFLEAAPPFSKCMTATIVLMLVKSSAGQMLEKKKS